MVLRRLQEGDIGALEELFSVYGSRIHSLCRRILGNDSDAEDATQEVFLRAWQKARTFSGRSSFSTWLYRLAVNHAINISRTARRRSTRSLSDLAEETLPPDQRPAPEEDAALAEERALLDRLLDSLPLEQRTVLVLREMEGMSYAEISQVLDLPPGTVTSRLVRGRERLRETLHRISPGHRPERVEGEKSGESRETGEGEKVE